MVLHFQKKLLVVGIIGIVIISGCTVLTPEVIMECLLGIVDGNYLQCLEAIFRQIYSDGFVSVSEKAIKAGVQFETLQLSEYQLTQQDTLTKFREECKTIEPKDLYRVKFDVSQQRFVTWIDAKSGQSLCFYKEKISGDDKFKAFTKIQGLGEIKTIRSKTGIQKMALGQNDEIFGELSRVFGSSGLQSLTADQNSILRNPNSTFSIEIVGKNDSISKLQGFAALPKQDYYFLTVNQNGKQISIVIDPITKKEYIETKQKTEEKEPKSIDIETVLKNLQEIDSELNSLKEY